MKYSDLKNIRAFCDGLTSTPDWKEVAQNIVDGETDFTVDNVRFINSDDIDRIQYDELSNDEYVLGCFNAWFLSDVTGIDQDVFEAMQKAEAFEAIGKLVISMGKLDELQQTYARWDGYGHHFNAYDGNEEELSVDGRMFHVFDNR